MTSPTEVRFPRGESYAQLRDRAASTLDELRVAHPDETFAVVTHGGVVRALLATLLHLPDDRAFALDVGYRRVSVVDWFDETPVVRLVNGAAADVPAQLAG
jgi:alpha-ribazole phosphatase